MRFAMRPHLIAAFLALGAVGAARAQPFDPGVVAQQNQLYMEQEAQRQRSLELERQAFAAQQKAQTEQTLARLRAGAGPSAPAAVSQREAAAYAADADTLRRIEAETAASERSTKRSKPMP